MKSSPLLGLRTFGQSIWLDFLRRSLYTSGQLQRMIQEDGLRGIISNLATFDNAISGSHDYDDDIRALALKGKSAREIYETLTVEDVQHAADIFRPIYDESNGQDGFVSLEISPHLARDTTSTIEQARHLWAALNRPNAMIKVPATIQGLPAIRQLIADGINVNVTLLFGLPRYREVANAYIAGLEARAKQGKPLNHVASVASFFLSRIDVLVDPMLEDLMKRDGPRAKIAKSLHGQTAIDSARVAYQMFDEIFGGERFQGLAVQGAHPQRLLWASTSTKNPTYSDVKYVEALIGPQTVSTLPLETLNAYRDHGDPAPRLEEDGEHALRLLHTLAEVGIDLEQTTQQLENEGVRKFIKPFDDLMETLENERAAALEALVDPETLHLGRYERDVQNQLDTLEQDQFTARLWRKDPSLWKHDTQDQRVIKNALGWLHVAERMEENIQELSAFLAEVQDAGFKHVVHMGMGGSSLAPLTFQRTFAPSRGLPLTVLDTTDPATILNIERSLPLAETLFIVASKSGTTAEPLAFGDYFYAKLKAHKGDRAGANMVGITDPGTPLEVLSRERSFRRVFLNFADIGGRYSALSYFGLVPAALMGVDVRELLLRSLRMEHACACCVPTAENPGILLGAAMGELALRGRDKVTFLIPEAVTALGMWLEQLLAESTGKESSGLVPVAGEPLGGPPVYGDDRLFVHIRLKDQENDEAQERNVAALREAGHPFVTIQMDDRLDLGQEFIRWEIATATAGAVFGINAFNQPNVQESKDNTNRLLDMVRRRGQLPQEEPTLVEGPLALHVGDTAPTAPATLARFLDQKRPGDYVALMAYLTEEPETEQALQAIRLRLRDGLGLATTLGYGPRFLHSTGQLHKGGPNTGLFLQLTADDAEDMDVPGQPYTFGLLRSAQAQGDLEALRKYGRRVMRVHLGANAIDSLKYLATVLP